MLRTVALVSAIVVSSAFAQGTLPPPGKAKVGAVAAMVNGREIPDSAVERALRPVAQG